MALTIASPEHSFVQFGEQEEIEGCGLDVDFKLPVLEDNDIAFQFFIDTDTNAEADALCGADDDRVRVGLVDNCDNPFDLEFTGLYPEKVRVSATRMLYMWTHGLPGFTGVYPVEKCF